MYKAIIVDDEQIFRETLISRINWETCNLEVCGQARDGLEALALIERTAPDIVICDIKMPRLDGLGVLQRLPAPENIKFIIVSGYNDFEFTRQAIKYGAFDYLLKPGDDEELIGVLLRAVESLDRIRARQNEDIALQVEIRQKILEKYESLLIHYAEARNLGAIENQIDDFYSAFDASYPPEAYQSSYLEFVVAANKICAIFRLDIKEIMPRFIQRHQPILTPDQKPALVENVKEIFREIINSLICSPDHEGKKVVREVLDYLEANYAEKLSLEVISRRYYINPTYFSHLFKNITGENFSAYLTAKRVNRAKELLAGGSFKIYQVAALVGYDDDKYFSQIFKKHTGKSPSEYLGPK